MAFTEVWRPPANVGCFDRHGRGTNATNLSVLGGEIAAPAAPLTLLPRREYKSNGYMRVSCNGGLNQMRAAICDMVTIARHLNLTLVIPDLDKTSFWADTSDFGDIFDVQHFIDSLRDEVKIVRTLPAKFNRKVQNNLLSIPPISWSSENYYLKQVLPLFRKHKVVHFQKTDARLANNLPVHLQKLRCRVNYEALRFSPMTEALGHKLVSLLRREGFFVVLHLRYEMDMLSFSGCAHGCTGEETDVLTEMRYSRPSWKEKEIDSEKKRLEGLCPLTPEETTLTLRALGFDQNTRICIASGEIYGGDRRMAALQAAYPNIVRKEMLLTVDELTPLRNHSNQMAALDYLVSLGSDVFIPTYDGNMAKMSKGIAGSMDSARPSSWTGESWCPSWIHIKVGSYLGINFPWQFKICTRTRWASLQDGKQSWTVPRKRTTSIRIQRNASNKRLSLSRPALQSDVRLVRLPRYWPGQSHSLAGGK